MNKQDIISNVAESTGLSKKAAGDAVEAVLNSISAGLKGGEDVTLVGFGTFSVGTRAARTGRNPRTGAEIKIKASRVPKFKPGKSLKDAVSK